MKIKSWDRDYRLSKFFLLISIAYIFIAFTWVVVIRQSEPSGSFAFSVFIDFFIFLVSFLVFTQRMTNLRNLRSWLNMDELRPIMNFSSSQLEQLCLQTLKDLAKELVEAEQKHSMPMAHERIIARDNLQKCYRFFREHDFIKPTPWERFFPQPETQK